MRLAYSGATVIAIGISRHPSFPRKLIVRAQFTSQNDVWNAGQRSHNVDRLLADSLNVRKVSEAALAKLPVSANSGSRRFPLADV
jgi:hypothetical protein